MLRGERETFYEAQRRNRRAGWRFSVLALVTILILGLPVSILISPVVTTLGLIALDVLDLLVPVPDVTERIVQVIDTFAEAEGSQQVELAQTDMVTAVVALVVPGVIAMGMAWLCVRRLFMRSAAGAVVMLAGGHRPDPADIEERQLVNLVEEMAIAAGVPPPKVAILDSEMVNAAVVGRSIQDVTVLVPRGLHGQLGRDETGALIADLLAYVVNGDLRTALRIASVFQTFELVGAFLAAPMSRKTRRVLWRLFKLALRPRSRLGDGSEAEYIAEELADVSQLGGDDPDAGAKLRHLPFVFASLAFMLNQLLVGLVIGNLMGALWRRRCLLADATAVELTRNPTALARAIRHLEEHGTPMTTGQWSHLFLVGPEVAQARDQRRHEKRMKEIWGNGDTPRSAMSLRAAQRHVAEVQATARAQAETGTEEAQEQPDGISSTSKTDSAMGMALDNFIPSPKVRLKRLLALGAEVDYSEQDSRAGLTWQDLSPVARVVVVALLTIVVVLLVAAAVMWIGLLIFLICLTVGIQLLVLAPLVLGVHALTH